MAEAEAPGDVTSLAEYRRTERQAAFTRTVPGYIIKGIPVIRATSGQIYGYVYEAGSQGPIYKSPFEMDADTQEALGLPDEVREAVNDVLDQPFSWPSALA